MLIKEAFESAYGVIVNGNFYGGYSGGLDDESDRVEVFRLGEPIPLDSDRVPTYLQDEVCLFCDCTLAEAKEGRVPASIEPRRLGQCSESWSAGKPTPGHLFCPKTFAEWAASSLVDGDDSSVDADTDGDHIPNLLEFAFGMDPVKPETTKLPRASQDFSGQNVALTYQVDRAAGGVIVRVEYVELLGQEWKDISLAHSPHRSKYWESRALWRLVGFFCQPHRRLPFCVLLPSSSVGFTQ